MKQIDCYLDFGSPQAYLAFERLPEALLGLSWSVRYRPVLSAATRTVAGLGAPFESSDTERAWRRREALWLAREHGVPLQLPARETFDPQPLLRLALACDAHGAPPNRYVCGRVFGHVWRGGLDPLEPARLAALHRELAPPRDPQDAAVEAQLRADTDAARARGLFEVPAFVVDDDRLFSGFNALPQLRACLEGDPWFDGPDWGNARPRSAAASG